MQYIKKAWTRNWVGYFFLTPWIIGILGLTAIPMGVSLYLSFTDYDMFTPAKWTGLDNYSEMFSDDKYIASIKVTLHYVLLSVPISLSVALVIAAILNRGMRGLKIYRAIYYVPSLFGGSVAVALLWRQIFGGDGLLSNLLEFLGLEDVNLLSDPNTALYTIIVLSVWQFGSPMVIFLAGLQQIPMDLYEASMIDGAGKIKRFFKITLPLLTPIIFFNLVMGIIGAFQAFTPAYIVSGGSGGPLNSTLFYTLYLYQKGFTQFHMGYASAMAWILLITISFVTALVFLSAKKWVYYEQ